MQIFEVKNKNDWKDDASEFLQSWGYGEFLKSVGRNVERLELKKNSGESEFAQYIVSPGPWGIMYVYMPRINLNTDYIQMLIPYFKKRGFAFVRVEPVNRMTVDSFKTKQTINRQPHFSWLLDINKDTELLLADMHPKTRYNIKLAEKRGVAIDESKNLDLYWNLNNETTKRNNFVTHPKEYIEQLLALGNVYQFNALLDGKAIASAIILVSNKKGIYFLGASSDLHRNVMSPYLLHWSIIKKLKELGCVAYDFWGIAQPSEEGKDSAECFHGYCWDSKDPLAGVSRFKAGFGGNLKVYPDALDIILEPFKYVCVSLVKKVRGETIVGHPKKK